MMRNSKMGRALSKKQLIGGERKLALVGALGPWMCRMGCPTQNNQLCPAYKAHMF